MTNIGSERHKDERLIPNPAVLKTMALFKSRWRKCFGPFIVVLCLLYIFGESNIISTSFFWILWGLVGIVGVIFGLLLLSVGTREHERYVLEEAGIRTKFVVDPDHRQRSGVSPPHLLVVEVVPGMQGLSLGIAKGDVIVRGTLKFDRSPGKPDVVKELLVMRDGDIFTVPRHV